MSMMTKAVETVACINPNQWNPDNRNFFLRCCVAGAGIYTFTNGLQGLRPLKTRVQHVQSSTTLPAPMPPTNPNTGALDLADDGDGKPPVTRVHALNAETASAPPPSRQLDAPSTSSYATVADVAGNVLKMFLGVWSIFAAVSPNK